MPRRPISFRGFTLLELSIVLTLIAVLLGGGLVLTTASYQKKQMEATLATMDAIEAALLNYSVAYNRIPCPGDITLTSTSANYGLEAGAGTGSSILTGTGVCTGSGMLPKATFTSPSGVSEGSVPTRALQLPDSYMYDGWGRHLRYVVDPTFTATSSLPVPMGGLICPSKSPISVYDASATATTITNATATARSATAIYTLISHGVNGHGAFTSNGSTVNAGSVNDAESVNCHCDSNGVTTTSSMVQTSYPASYVQKAITANPSNALDSFDDVVAYKEAWQMQTANSPLAVTQTGSCYYLAAGTASSPYMWVYQYSGTTTRKITNPTQMPTGGVYGLQFSHDNTLLAVGQIYNAGALPGPGMLYNFGTNGLSYSSTYFNPTLSTGSLVSQIVFSPDTNYIATGGVMGYSSVNVTVALSSGTGYSTLNPIISGPTSQGIQWTNDGSQLLTALYQGNAAGKYVNIYNHVGQNLTLGTQIDVTAYGAHNPVLISSMSLDPTQTYLALGENGVTYANRQMPIVIANPLTTPTAISGVTGSGLKTYSGGNSANGVAWSPDGNYLAIALNSSDTGTSGVLDVYAFNSANAPTYFSTVTFSGSACGGGMNGTYVSWSADSKYLAVATTNSGAQLCIYSHNGTVFTNITSSFFSGVSLPTGLVNAVTWSH